jgi:hypothetical protein
MMNQQRGGQLANENDLKLEVPKEASQDCQTLVEHVQRTASAAALARGSGPSAVGAPAAAAATAAAASVSIVPRARLSAHR